MKRLALLGLLAMAGAGCVTTAVDKAITDDLRQKDPTACENGLVWGRPADAPADCAEQDSREACQERCVAPGPRISGPHPVAQ